MTKEIVGQGWVFPPKIGPHGGMALTNLHTEIEQAIKIIVMTSPGQRVMRPKFGCRIHELIFAPNNRDTHARAERYVEEALAMWEPRITVIAIRAGADFDRHKPTHSGHTMIIEIDYEIKKTRDRRSLVYPFYLIPEED